MRRTALLLTALFGAMTALLAALLAPVHLRAVDPRVLEETSRNGKSLVQVSEELAASNPAVAKIILRAAENLDVLRTEDALEALRAAAESKPAAKNLLQELERGAAGPVQVQETPVLTALRRREDREKLAGAIFSADARRILLNRGLTNLTMFAPVSSGAGFPLDAAILTTAFLIEQGAVSSLGRTETALKDQIIQMSARGFSTNHVTALEDLYLDVFALAKRLSSEQLVAFVSSLQNFSALDRLARFLQDRPGTLPILFTSVVLSRDGDRVAQYITKYPETGVSDLRFALGLGTKAVTELIGEQTPIYRAAFHNFLLSTPKLAFASDPLRRLAIQYPMLALLLKWLLLLAGGLALAYAARLARSRETEESQQWVPQFGFSRRLTFAFVFLALAVLLGEPYLAQGEAEEKPAPRVVFPIFAAAASAAANAQTQPTGFMINPSTLIAMGVFLVLQSSIYIFCLTKLAEIRRQPLSGPMKLKLLENEENLFDAGLYLGLFGTAASLILLTLGLIKPSLVSAYSSTLFGILFVALLKIFHVRPYKRNLIIESAAAEDEE